MCDAFLVNHPGCQITDRNLGPLFGEANSRAATVNNALKGFKACGIEPFNPLISDDSDFAPAITTERENPSDEAEAPIEKSRSDGPEKAVTRKRNIVNSSSEDDQDDSIPLSVLSYEIESTSTPEERGVAAEGSSGTVFKTAKEAAKKNLFSIDDRLDRVVQTRACGI
ncbi:unnamed protein product [Acanthoscelides obtectus]|uniref:Uncharacterized protein n=1 Tax=Acanthoscelides obtectus TaxID=200917 RepID=A0A9P0NVI5_ACAOB|nr:unnamed protein product [Acanthoscelides obtectus]CAK1647918.1 hypothetical protein AOBTE_LOCUS15454 [Acanthoscelides obtectus]